MKYIILTVALASIALAGCQKAEEPAAAPTPAPAAAVTTGAPAAGTPGQKSDSPLQAPSATATQPQ
jgi:nitrous oxide reductase accessory protein NosL